MPSREQIAKETTRNPKPRRWTASQIDRKRQLDREAQRTLRAKTKNRLQQLEEQVKLFQSNDDDRVQQLYAQIDRQETELRQLREVLSTISKSLSTVQVQQPVQVFNSPGQVINSSPDPTDIVWPDFDFNSSSSTLCSNCGNSTRTSSDSSASPPPSQSIADLASSITKNKNLDGRLWLLAGGILNHILRNPELSPPITTRYDSDIAIRAIFEGWPVVVERYDLDAGWQWLKELDERIYLHNSKQDRLMHLRNVRLVFLRQYFRTAEYDSQIPDFFRAGHAEKNIQHDALIEHFPWPGFRQRLLFEPTRFATDRFMDALRVNLSFPWNKDEGDLYVVENGLYDYSPEFVSRILDFRCYAARKEFFDMMPELKADIPCSMVMLRELVPFSPLPLIGESQVVEICEEDLTEIMEGC